MQTSQVLKLTALCVAFGVSAAAYAGPLAYDQNVTPGVIFGSGNTNGGFTVDRSNGIELGMRGKLRHNASGAPENTFNSNGDGTYSFATGVAPTQSSPTGVWSFEWSINVDALTAGGRTLDDLTYRMGADSDASQGVNYNVFDPINGGNNNNGEACWDHSMGTNTTTEANDTKVNCLPANANRLAEYTAALANNYVAQNSWKGVWFIPGYDPTVDGTYNFYLAAFDAAGAQLARTDIQIIAGQGGAAVVPEPGSLALAGLALFGLAAARRRRS